MKYNFRVTAILLALFVSAQIVGLVLVNGSIEDIKTLPSGQIVIEHSETPVERPQTQGFESLAYILIGVAIATGLLLIIAKFGLLKLWKAWFFLAIWLTVTVALSVYISWIYATAIAILLAVAKIFYRDPIIYNATEVLVYSGIVVLFTPIFDILWVTVLLLAISVYDIIAVRRTKHMVTMAQFLIQGGLFAGLAVPLEKGKRLSRSKIRPVAKGAKAVKQQAAILGGGDIAFPMLFTAVLLEWLITAQGLERSMAFGLSLIVTVTATAALAGLFWIAKKGKFYPAMPFLTAGCLVGLAIIQALLLL